MQEAYMKVVAQKADPAASIRKNGKGFETTIINVMEDGSERQKRVQSGRKKDLVKQLEKLPVSNVTGYEIEVNKGWNRIELFTFKGVM